MKIYNFIPYSPSDAPSTNVGKGRNEVAKEVFGKNINLGWAYNQYMNLLPNDEDWGCFIDHDAMWTTYNWYNQLESIIDKHPEYSLFTVKTNNVYSKIQKGPRFLRHIKNVAAHREYGLKLQEEKYNEVTEMGRNNLLSGVVILYKKSTWNKIKFKNGFLTVDRNIHKDLIRNGYKTGLMEGVYVYHWYRGK